MAESGHAGYPDWSTNPTVSYTLSVCLPISFHFGPALIYTCVGMNYETTFEAELLERTRHCQVWGYDYRSNSFGYHIKPNYRTHFFSWGLANFDSHEPHNNPKLYTLKTLLEINSSYALLSPFYFLLIKCSNQSMTILIYSKSI